nr:MAG TPA: hypothetical protein [Caudoviricetes sp.]
MSYPPLNGRWGKNRTFYTRISSLCKSISHHS